MHLDKTSLHGGIGYFMTGDFVQMVQRIRRVGLRSVALPIIGAVSVLLVACGATDEDVVVPTTAVIEPDTPVAVAPEPTEEPPSTPAPVAADPDLKPATAGGNLVTAQPTATLQAPILIEDDAERSRAVRLRTLWGWNTDLNERIGNRSSQGPNYADRSAELRSRIRSPRLHER